MANLDPWHYAAKTRNEHAEQVALFMWANMAMRVGPLLAQDVNSYNVQGYAMKAFEREGGDPLWQLKWLYAVHNQGHGDAVHGGRAKAEGVKPGVSDVCLPFPMSYPDRRSDYHGLYIELKRKDKGAPSSDQLEFQADMRLIGYKCEIIHGWELARDELLSYLNKL